MSALDIARTGMDIQSAMLDIIAHNIANVNTTAFKESAIAAKDLGYIIRSAKGAIVTSNGDTIPSDMRYGMGVAVGSVYQNYLQGTLVPSDSEYSIAIDGPGFLSVTLPSGETGYTRDGHLSVNANRELVDSNGYIIEPVIVIPTDAMSITITPNGQVQVQQPQQSDLTLVGTLELTRFNVEQLDPVGNNIYKLPPTGEIVLQDAPDSNGLGLIRQRFLEGSNVNVIEQFAAMMKAEKAYQAGSKTMQTYEQMMRSSLDIRA